MKTKILLFLLSISYAVAGPHASGHSSSHSSVHAISHPSSVHETPHTTAPHPAAHAPEPMHFSRPALRPIVIRHYVYRSSPSSHFFFYYWWFARPQYYPVYVHADNAASSVVTWNEENADNRVNWWKVSGWLAASFALVAFGVWLVGRR